MKGCWESLESKIKEQKNQAREREQDIKSPFSNTTINS